MQSGIGPRVTFLKSLSAAVLLTAITAMGARAQERPTGAPETAAPAEPAEYRTGDYRSPTPLTLHGATVVSSAEAMALWKANGALVHRRDAEAAETRQFAAGNLVARARAPQHSRKCVVAQHRQWRARPGGGGLFSGTAPAAHRRRSHSVGTVLLPQKLLDVMERSKARHRARICPRPLVPRRCRWMGGNRRHANARRAGRACPVKRS